MTPRGDEWTEVELGQLGSVVTGRTPPKAEPELFGAEYPFFTPSDMSYGDRSPPTERFISEAGAKRFRRIRLPSGSTCFVCIGATIGKVCLTSQPSFTNQQLNSIIPDEAHHDPRFVYYLLVSVADDIKALASGAATPIINKSSFSAFKVKVPPLSTQQRIAAILSAYDDLIENNTRRIAILEEMARRLYEEWFVRFRFPKDLSKTYQEGSTWPTERFGDHADVTDYVANGSFAALKANVTYHSSPEFAILVRTKDHNQGWMGDFVYVDENSFNFLKKSDLRVGDIVVSNVGNVGVVFRVPDLGRPTTLGPNAVRVRPKVNSDFFLHFLSGSIGQGLLASISSGAAQQKFNKTELRNLQIPWPEQKLQQAFCQAVAPIELQKETLRKSNANLRTQRDLLLPKLVSGEIDVSGAEAALEAAE